MGNLNIIKEGKKQACLTKESPGEENLLCQSAYLTDFLALIIIN